ncbi:MAG: CHAT domain-containing protein, partial [Cyanobacteria bacterium J06638_38]
LKTFNKRELYKEENATKETFKQALSSNTIVHVATHSEVSDDDPLFSSIYLTSRDSKSELVSDQALYAYELFDAELNTDLLVLNSCSSGSGSFLQGAGIRGISRVLRYAGAKSLALNLWVVNDKLASDFSTRFYTAINDGKSKSESFRAAKIAQIESGNANPHYWGAFMMLGNSSPIVAEKSRARPSIITLGIGLLIGLGVYARRKSG